MTNRILAAALAAALASPAAAQGVGQRAREAMGRPATQPAPAQATPQPQASGQAAPQYTLTDAQRQAFGAVHARGQLAIQASQLAATRATSPEVKSLASRILSEHQRADQELTNIVASRGGGDVNALPSIADKQKLDGELAQLQTKSGEEFDRDYVAFVTRNHPAFVDELKRAREATPGKDSAFKKWVDGYEDVEEEHLTAMRQLKAQRQARKPPAR
jgi:putative membrane protein